MSSLAKRTHPSRPWRARAKRDMIEHFLGYYATKEEADAAERAFGELHPSQRGRNGHWFGTA